MRFARIVFGIAGVYGLAVVLPMYFERARFEVAAPPVVTHLELYYGFVGVTLAWQVAFIIIAVQPARYRTIMIPSILEKFTYALAVLVLGFQNRVASVIM